MFKTRLARWG